MRSLTEKFIFQEYEVVTYSYATLMSDHNLATLLLSPLYQVGTLTACFPTKMFSAC